MLWNEPNNRSHWDFEIDWRHFGVMTRPAVTALPVCFTPEHAGERAHHTSPPRRPEFGELCARMVRRYGS